MRTHYNTVLAILAITSLSMAKAAELPLGSDNTFVAAQVQQVMNSRHLLVLDQVNGQASAPLVATAGRRSSIERSTQEQESGAMRWLYLAAPNKRTFFSYAAARRGRPAELRVVVRLSLL